MEFARPIDSASTEQPTIFDVMAEKNAESLIKPLFDSFISEIFTTPLRWKSEMYYCGRAALDLFMLNSFQGTLTEVIYGIKRESNRGNRKIFVSFITILECHIIPYISHKVPKIPAKILKILGLMDAAIKLAYMTGDCKSFGLAHFLLGIVYRQNDFNWYDEEDFISKCIKWILLTGQFLLYLAQSGVFEKIKQLRDRPLNQTSKNTSTPPDMTKLCPPAHPNGCPVPLKAGICPVCLTSWKNPVAFPSGYVYCKNCVKNTCPITKISFDFKHLFPIYL